MERKDGQVNLDGWTAPNDWRSYFDRQLVPIIEGMSSEDRRLIIFTEITRVTNIIDQALTAALPKTSVSLTDSLTVNQSWEDTVVHDAISAVAKRKAEEKMLPGQRALLQDM